MYVSLSSARFSDQQRDGCCLSIRDRCAGWPRYEECDDTRDAVPRIPRVVCYVQYCMCQDIIRGGKRGSPLPLKINSLLILDHISQKPFEVVHVDDSKSGVIGCSAQHQQQRWMANFTVARHGLSVVGDQRD